MDEARKLSDLVSVGPAAIKDFQLLGIRTVEQLKGKDPERLYHQLCSITDRNHDICVLDVFRAAIAQAEDALLPAEQKNWWYWSRERKAKNG